MRNVGQTLCKRSIGQSLRTVEGSSRDEWRLARTYGREAVERLVEIMRNKKNTTLSLRAAESCSFGDLVGPLRL